MKRNHVFMLLVAAFITVIFTGCSGMFNNPTVYTESDVVGLWQLDGTQEFIRFTLEKGQGELMESTLAAYKDYYVGCEWDEADDVYESSLLYLGNGYFFWKIVTDEMTQIALMDNHGADIPVLYTINSITNGTMTLTTKSGKTLRYTKMVETK